MEDMNRRPISSRSTLWAQACTNSLCNRGISANLISSLSVVFALAGASCLLLIEGWIAPLLFAIAIQARLLCNLFDGMVALQLGTKSSIGALYNELPDRITDSIFLISAAYICHQPELGWACALFAALTAYIRLFGASLGLPQDFRGPMAKQHRMALLSVASVLTSLEILWHGHLSVSYPIALSIIAIGSLITCGTRTYAIVRKLEAQL